MAPCELQQNSYTCDVGYKWLTQTGGEWHSGDEKKCATFPGDRWHCREQQGAAMALCAVRALNACIYCCLIGPKCLCECVCVGVRQRVGGRGGCQENANFTCTLLHSKELFIRITCMTISFCVSFPFYLQQ